MSQAHTPEPWKIGNRGMIYTDDLRVAIVEPCKDASIEEQAANATRIVACVNGCAGLNPAAYRQVVEALKQLQWAHGAETLTGGVTCHCVAHEQAKHALAAAKAQP